MNDLLARSLPVTGTSPWPMACHHAKVPTSPTLGAIETVKVTEMLLKALRMAREMQKYRLVQPFRKTTAVTKVDDDRAHDLEIPLPRTHLRPPACIRKLRKDVLSSTETPGNIHIHSGEKQIHGGTSTQWRKRVSRSHPHRPGRVSET